MKRTFYRLTAEMKKIFTPATGIARNIPVNDSGKARFIDVQRRLRIYLRALWNCDFVIKQAEIDSLGNVTSTPFIEHDAINLPEAFYDRAADNGRLITGVEMYRAAITHAAAHLIFTGKPLSSSSLDKWHITLISVIEDARIEALAIRQFPGLKYLWAFHHTATSQNNQTTGDYLDRLARSLLDDSYQDDDTWIAQGRSLFNAVENLEDHHISRTIGIKLADAFREKKLKFNIDTDLPSAAYRDDNRFVWNRRESPLEVYSPFLRSRSTVGTEDEDKDMKSRAAPKSLESANEQQTAATYFYPEWNYRSLTEDASWVTLRERIHGSGKLKIIEDILAENQHTISRMKSLLRAIRDGATQRIRKLEVGDEIDINAAIRAQVDLRLGIQPDTRIMLRSIRKTRDISVLILLDLSRSMNEKLQDRRYSALQLTQQVCVLFSEAINAVGDPFAIHGFYSDSRHHVEYFRLKDFDEPYDDGPKSRIAGLTGRRGTRMGAAIRHATHHFNQQKSSKKLLLIMTDGEPSDVDVPDRKYLHDDTKKSVETASRNGIRSYCINLDPGADQYVSRIFGATNYLVVDHIKSLPEKVLSIYAGFSR